MKHAWRVCKIAEDKRVITIWMAYLEAFSFLAGTTIHKMLFH